MFPPANAGVAEDRAIEFVRGQDIQRWTRLDHRHHTFSDAT
jgi:hypothetical protein